MGATERKRQKQKPTTHTHTTTHTTTHPFDVNCLMDLICVTFYWAKERTLHFSCAAPKAFSHYFSKWHTNDLICESKKNVWSHLNVSQCDSKICYYGNRFLVIKALNSGPKMKYIWNCQIVTYPQYTNIFDFIVHRIDV